MKMSDVLHSIADLLAASEYDLTELPTQYVGNKVSQTKIPVFHKSLVQGFYCS